MAYELLLKYIKIAIQIFLLFFHLLNMSLAALVKYGYLALKESPLLTSEEELKKFLLEKEQAFSNK